MSWPVQYSNIWCAIRLDSGGKGAQPRKTILADHQKKWELCPRQTALYSSCLPKTSENYVHLANLSWNGAVKSQTWHEAHDSLGMPLD